MYIGPGTISSSNVISGEIDVLDFVHKLFHIYDIFSKTTQALRTNSKIFLYVQNLFANFNQTLHTISSSD